MSRTNKKYASKAKFPVRLHDMMTYVESQGLESIIGWVLGGRGFMIYDPEKLVQILSIFFEQTKYNSFLRQLNMWDFDRILHGPNKGMYMHPYFVQGNRALCGQIVRSIKQKSTRTRRQKKRQVSTSDSSTSSEGETSLGSFRSNNECSFQQLANNFELSSDEEEGAFAFVQKAPAESYNTKTTEGPQQSREIGAPLELKSVNESEGDFFYKTYSTFAPWLKPTPLHDERPEPVALQSEFSVFPTRSSLTSKFGEILDDYAHLFEGEEEDELFEKSPADFGEILEDYEHLFEAEEEDDLFKPCTP